MNLTNRIRVALLLPALTLLIGGCGSGASDSAKPGASEHGPPWVTLDDSRIGASSSGPTIKDGKPLLDASGVHVMRFSVTNSEFVDLLEGICNHFEVSITVRPEELASRGITIEAHGASAQAALEDVARQCKLQLESDGEKKWRLIAPNSENAAEKTITYASE